MRYSNSKLMKLSLITVVYNADRYLKDCIESVISQTYANIEYIVIDGASTDNTLAIIESYKQHIHYFISEKDKGMYDALNKGILVATGDIIGILNADDMLASPLVIAKIIETFKLSNVDAVYGNLNYVDPKTLHIIRKWVAKPYTIQGLKFGWMPAHPTFYVKKEIYERYGVFALDYGTAADYQLMLRFLYQHHINAICINELIVNMRIGGMSNESFEQRYKAFINDYRAMKYSGIPFAFLAVLVKKLRKITQFFG
jgi:glycosyltransferase involved in cell wall biosynthesis